MIYFEKTASLMYDLSNNLASSLIQQLFTKAENMHGYGTRSATRGNYFVKSSRLDFDFDDRDQQVGAVLWLYDLSEWQMTQIQ